MYRNFCFTALILVVVIFGTGCGTITNKAPSDVRLRSNPSGASYRIHDISGNEIFTSHTTATLFKFGIEMTDRFYVLYDRDGSLYCNATRNSEGSYSFTDDFGKTVAITSDMYLYDRERSLIEIRVNNPSSFLTPTKIKWDESYDIVTFNLADFPPQTAGLKQIPSFWAWATPIIFIGAGAGLYINNNEREMPQTQAEYNKIKSANDERIMLQYTGLGLMTIGASSFLTDLITGNLKKDSKTISTRFSQTTTRRAGSTPAPSKSIDKAVETLLVQATTGLSKQSSIAIVDIAIDEPAIRNFVSGEAEYVLVKEGFKVVDREQLDKIRNEQRIQASGEIDDDTAVRMGRFAGADYILTGRIDGEGSLRRLRFRILDVTTGFVYNSVRDSYENHAPIPNPLGIERAIALAIQQATTSVSRNAKIAIVDVSGHTNYREYITGETEFILINSGFTIIDRSELDRIREEQRLQYSEDFDDRTATELGRLAGAEHIVTIRADGMDALRRLRIRILHTETALVMGIASVHYEGIDGQTAIQTIERATELAIEHIAQRVRKESTIAIVQISASQTAQRDFITGETEALLRSHDYTIVDRSQLDRIRSEHGFQLSGEVDDRTIVNIGRFSGADYLITGRVDGTDALQRLRLRVLDTRTAEVVYAVSIRF